MSALNCSYTCDNFIWKFPPALVVEKTNFNNEVCWKSTNPNEVEISKGNVELILRVVSPLVNSKSLPIRSIFTSL